MPADKLSAGNSKEIVKPETFQVQDGLIAIMRMKFHRLYFTIQQAHQFLKPLTFKRLEDSKPQNAKLELENVERVKSAVKYLEAALIGVGPVGDFTTLKAIAPGPWPMLNNDDDEPLMNRLPSTPSLPKEKDILKELKEVKEFSPKDVSPKDVYQGDLTEWTPTKPSTPPPSCPKCRLLMLQVDHQKQMIQKLDKQLQSLSNQVQEATTARRIMETELEQLTALLFSQANVMVEREVKARHEAEDNLEQVMTKLKQLEK